MPTSPSPEYLPLQPTLPPHTDDNGQHHENSPSFDHATWFPENKLVTSTKKQ